MTSVAIDRKTCYKHSSSIENHASESFESHKGKGADKGSHHGKALGSRTKPTPSKWDDAQKWLVGFSGGGNDRHSKSKPRNSNADDRRLLHSASQRGRDSCSSADVGLEEDLALQNGFRDEGETKKIDCSDLIWRINKPMADSQLEVKAISLRDFGTEMTPIASQDPSRTATPLRATTPVLTSPISSRSSTPGRCRQGGNSFESFRTGVKNLERNNETLLFGTTGGNGLALNRDREGSSDGRNMVGGLEQIRNSNSLESRAMAWDEAERTKYMARYSFAYVILDLYMH